MIGSSWWSWLLLISLLLLQFSLCAHKLNPIKGGKVLTHATQKPTKQIKHFLLSLLQLFFSPITITQWVRKSRLRKLQMPKHVKWHMLREKKVWSRKQEKFLLLVESISFLSLFHLLNAVVQLNFAVWKGSSKNFSLSYVNL